MNERFNDKFTHGCLSLQCLRSRAEAKVIIEACADTTMTYDRSGVLVVSGVDNPHAVVCGFHLAAPNQDYIDDLVDALAALNPDVVLHMHCTGRDFIETMRQRLLEKLVLANVGSRYTYGV
jgi:7,8-dihydropterin-6-yl-methyl-4-(beta-D-ribofuranosyl)aminobenzene 5'-phosphate synthase